MKFKYIFVVLGLVFVFGRYPVEPLDGSIKSIEVTYLDRSFERVTELISNESEIERLKKMCGLQWYHIFPLVSNEGHPFYLLKITYTDGVVKQLYVDQDELGEGSNKNSKLYEYLLSVYS